MKDKDLINQDTVIMLQYIYWCEMKDCGDDKAPLTPMLQYTCEYKTNKTIKIIRYRLNINIK